MNLQYKNQTEIDAISAAWSLILSQDAEALVEMIFGESMRGWSKDLVPGSITKLETSAYGGVIRGYIHCTFIGVDSCGNKVVNRQYISLFQYLIEQ